MQPQKLCLKWNNHTTNLLSVLGAFQQKDMLVDVTISCEGQNIKAHKIILSACSPYFQSIFLDNPCHHPIIIINGMKYEDITAILNFMYKGEVNVSHDGLSSFLQAAETLKVKGLAEVCGEKKSSTNSISQEVQQSEQNRPQRTDTPPRKRQRNRKRSLSDSNRSDDEGSSRKQHREPSSPEVHELSGDESFTGDNNSNGPPFNSVPRVPQNVYSRSHQSSSNMGGEEDDEYELEPSKLLEQTLTTETVSMNNSNSDNNLRIERIMGNATEIESSSMQEPESPPDIKPIIEYGESSAGPSEGSMLLYNEQSQPGPSNMQDGSLLHDNSHAQEYVMDMLLQSARRHGENKMNNHQNNDCSKFKCEHCSYVTEKMINFEKHLSIHISKTFDCHKCGEEFHIEMDLCRHLCAFSGLKTFGCEFCTKEFGFETSLRKHVRRHTGYQTFSCNYCSQKFNEKSELLRHLKSHTEVKKSDCHLCEKSFREKKDLVRHLQSHTGEKPHSCQECGKKFSRKNDLMRHSRLHTGERHFNCEYCGKEFYRKDKLKIHVRIHTGEKPFTCEYCGRSFAAKTDMLRHFRLHSSFQCEYCGQNFSSKNSVNDHVCKKSFESVMQTEL